MPNLNRKYDTLIFRKATTYTDCYQAKEPRQFGKALVPIKDGVTQEKQKKPKPDFVPLKDVHSMTPWNDPNIPFDLFHRPDPIIRKDPRKMQERYEESQDEDRAKVQKSRPKVVMHGPAYDLDAIQEPDRKIIVDNIYLTTSSIAQREAVTGVKKFKNVKAPLPNSYSKSNPIFIEPLEQPYISPEWRMDSVQWEARQFRAYVDPTKLFWLRREKPYKKRRLANSSEGGEASEIVFHQIPSSDPDLMTKGPYLESILFQTKKKFEIGPVVFE